MQVQSEDVTVQHWAYNVFRGALYSNLGGNFEAVKPQQTQPQPRITSSIEGGDIDNGYDVVASCSL